MIISSIVSAPPARATAPAETRENPAVPDHDGDADDASPPVTAKAPAPPGTGTVVDKVA